MSSRVVTGGGMGGFASKDLPNLKLITPAISRKIIWYLISLFFLPSNRFQCRPCNLFLDRFQAAPFSDVRVSIIVFENLPL